MDMKQFPREKEKLGWRKTINSILIIILCMGLIAGEVVYGIVYDVIHASPEFIADRLDSKESSRIYDADGKLIVEIGSESRENVKIEHVPQSVIDAFLAIEDSRFFEHHGFDLPRFLKAAMENLSTGSFAQGGSTLTMQMIDNSFFSSSLYDEDDPSTYSAKPTNDPWVKICRKVQEIFMSMDAEKKMPKKKIMEKYLNKINFGASARGIQMGSMYYFGKDVSKLTLSEAAFLAGVINAPNLYNPYTGYVTGSDGKNGIDHYQYAVKRRNETLDLMLYHGYITQEEHDLAVSAKLAFQLNGKSNFTSDQYSLTQYTAFINAAVDEVKELTGLDPYTTSMDIYTTMDREAQDLAESIGRGEVVAFPNDDQFQTAFSLINNETGEIIALCNGRDDEHDRAFEKRQPGSSIKPIIAYTPAFEYLGWDINRTLEDKPMDIYGTGKMLTNSNGKYQGKVPLEKAVAESLNTTAAATLKEVVAKIGRGGIVDYMKSMGYDEPGNHMTEDEFSLQYGIGGSTMQASPVQMAAAYSVLGNGGNYRKPHTVKKVLNKETKEETKPDTKPVQVLSSRSTYVMSEVLGNAVSKNYYNFLFILRGNYKAYGKTGTSDWGDVGHGIPNSAMKDIWMAGYTSKFSIATWCGYDGGVYKYITTAVNNMNIPGKIDKAMLDFVADKYGYPASIPNAK